METCRGHENSRDIRFNENQREKKVSKNRNEQNKEEHLHANKIKDRKKISGFTEQCFFICV